MARFPRIQSPCPWQANLASVMDGDVCRMCKRQVFDLTAMDDAARLAFFRDCAGEVCVSYKLPLRLAAVLAASAIALPAAAMPANNVAVTSADEIGDGEVIVLAGGIKDRHNVTFVDVDVEADRTIPELPVVEEPVRAGPKIKTPAGS